MPYNSAYSLDSQGAWHTVVTQRLVEPYCIRLANNSYDSLCLKPSPAVAVAIIKVMCSFRQPSCALLAATAHCSFLLQGIGFVSG